MKSVLFAFLFLGVSAQACPKLEGQYWCLFKLGNQEPTVDLLTIKQWEATDPSETGVTYFSFNYQDLGGEPDIFKANSTGISDGEGWITRCSKEKVLSVTPTGSMLSELYLDHEGHFVRATNQVVVQNCSPKK